MTAEKKQEILHEINRVLDFLQEVETYKEKWDKIFRGMNHKMQFIVAKARNVGNELLYNEGLKQMEIVNAITGALFSLGLRVVFDDSNKAIDIVKM